MLAIKNISIFPYNSILCSSLLPGVGENGYGSTYNNTPPPRTPSLFPSFLLPRLSLLNLRRLARRRQADGYVRDLQDCKRREDVQQRGDRIRNNGFELEGVEGENDGGVRVGVEARDVGGQRGDGRRGTGFGLREGRGVDGGF